MKKFYFMSNGKRLCGIIEGKEGKKSATLIISVHGWTSNKNSQTRKIICGALKRKGYAIFAFDFFGHGESEGKLGDMTISIGVKNIIDAAKHARKLGYKKIILIGSSFGGLCSVLATPKVNPVAIILKAPALDYRKIKFENKGGGFIKEYKKYNSYKAAKSINCPALIVHGDADIDVSPQQSIKFSKISRNFKFIELKDATHDFTKEQLKFMAKKSIEFLEQIKL